jgi:hypothetical protein
MALAGPWIEDSSGDKGVGPVDESTGDGKAWRAYNIVGDYADSGVVVLGSAGVKTFSNAAALADALANPTVGGVATFGHGYNGATWDRIRTVNTGQLVVTIKDAAGDEIDIDSYASADARPNVINVLPVGSRVQGYNGSTWDRLRAGAQVNVAAATGFLDVLPVSQYNVTPPTVTDTQYTHFQGDLRGSLRAVLYENNTSNPLGSSTTLADAFSNAPSRLTSVSLGFGYNGATWDRLRSGAFTASTTPTGVLSVTNLAVYNATPTTFTTGQYGHAHMGSRGALHAELWGSDSALPINFVGGPLADALANSIGSTALLDTVSRGWGFNGTTWDRIKTAIGGDGGSTGVAGAALMVSDGSVFRHSTSFSVGDARDGARFPMVGAMDWNGVSADRRRNNTEGTLLASAARTATTSTATQTNHNGRGVKLFLNVTSFGTGTLTLRIIDIDPVSATAVYAAQSTIPAANQINVLELYPGASSVPPFSGHTRNAGALPRSWQLSVVSSDGSSWTYSCGFALIV